MTALDWPPDPTAETFTTDELEAMVLRGLVWSKARREAIFDVLDRDDFHRGAHGTIFEAVRDLHHDREAVTFATLVDRLQRGGDLANVGGGTFVLRLCGGDYEGDPLMLATFLAEHSQKARLRDTAKGIVAEVEAPDFDAVEASERLVRNTRPLREYGIDRPADRWGALEDQLIHGVDRGEATGWPVFDPHYRVPTGLLTVVTGMPSSGKSTWLDNVAVMLAARRDWRFAVFSPESAPTERHMRRIGSILLGRPLTERSSRDDRDTVRAFLDAHFEWINSTEGVTPAEIVRRAEVIHRRKPINGLIVDPWNEVEHARDRNMREDEYISAELTRLRRFAKRTDAHVWVIAHPTKMHKVDGEYSAPSLYDISGGSQWRNKADFGLCVHRSLKGGPTTIHVLKVRFADHGSIGSVKLDFDPASEQFYEPGSRRRVLAQPRQEAM